MNTVPYEVSNLGAGWTCGKCGQWVPQGAEHFHNADRVLQNSSTTIVALPLTASPTWHQFERLLEKLDRLCEILSDVSRRQ